MRHWLFLGALIIWLGYIFTHGAKQEPTPIVDMSHAYEISPEQFKTEHNL